jgi:AAA15 family ATPase/GTPase
MTGLVFKKLWIVSKLEKAARIVSFQSGTNILTGENDVGKSTLIKSLYHSIGADAPQMDNTRWRRAKAFYCSEINLNGVSYFILRDGKHFGVFDSNMSLISKHSGISTEGGISDFLCDQLGFNIELEKSANGNLGVTSREVVRVFLKQLWFQFVPVFHGLQGRSTMKN